MKWKNLEKGNPGRQVKEEGVTNRVKCWSWARKMSFEVRFSNMDDCIPQQKLYEWSGWDRSLI